MLRVHGHPASQPSRAVIWACVLNDLPFTLMPADPDREESISHRGQVPTINDDGFVLSEMPAILGYLGDKHGWADLYPTDLQQRARISEYLHAHHCLTRLATTNLMAPHVLVAFGGSPTSNPLSYVNNLCIDAAMRDEHVLANGQALMKLIIDFLERAYLSDSEFLAGAQRASIADLACYEEIGQLAYAQLFDLSQHKVMHAWIERMRALPHHDDVHRFNLALGDIRTTPNSMPRFSSAADEAMQALSALEHVTILGSD